MVKWARVTRHDKARCIGQGIRHVGAKKNGNSLKRKRRTVRMFGYSSTIDWTQFTDTEKVTLENLPHGSGIDYDWHIYKQTNGKIRASNAYHGMDKYGSYVGSVDFSVTIDPKHLDDFRLTFQVNSAGRCWINKCDLRGYLEDTLYHAIAG